MQSSLRLAIGVQIDLSAGLGRIWLLVFDNFELLLKISKLFEDAIEERVTGGITYPGLHFQLRISGMSWPYSLM